jgi:hypothetical protein
LLSLFVATLCATTLTYAHPLSMTAAEVNITPTNITVQLDVLAEDLVLFHDLPTDPDTRVSYQALQHASTNHTSFIQRNLHLLDGDGQRLIGQAREIDPSDLPRSGILQVDWMKHRVRYHIDYPLTAPPSFLTILQRFGGEKAIIPAVMDLTLMQQGIWIGKPIQLQAGDPHTIALDWKNTAQRPENWQALQAKRAAEQEARLGIESYSGVYSYIYLTDEGLRHELLMPLLDLEEWLPIPRAHPAQLSVEEQKALIARLEELFHGEQGVEINGRSVSAMVQRVQYFGLEALDFAVAAEPKPISMYQGRVGIILDYPSAQSPTQVRMPWSRFTPRMASLRSMLFLWDEAVGEYFFTPDHPEWSWVGAGVSPYRFDLPIPRKYAPVFYQHIGFITLVAPLTWLAWAGWWRRTTQTLLASVSVVITFILAAGSMKMVHTMPSFSECDTVARALIHQTYVAVNERSEDAVYDTLALSVRGNLLDELYNEIVSGLILEEQGGAKAHVDRVRIQNAGPAAIEALPQGWARFDATCAWTARGTVEHWGHIHRRENAYKARLSIASNQQGWRITDIQFDQAEVVGASTSLRK